VLGGKRNPGVQNGRLVREGGTISNRKSPAIYPCKRIPLGEGGKTATRGTEPVRTVKEKATSQWGVRQGAREGKTKKIAANQTQGWGSFGALGPGGGGWGGEIWGGGRIMNLPWPDKLRSGKSESS